MYDCLGAGQYVSQQIFKGQDWRNYPENASAMYQVFPIVEQLFEIKAFLLEALTYDLSSQLHQEITLQLNALEETLERGAEEIGKIDLSFYRAPIGVLLAKVSEEIRYHLSNSFDIPLGRDKSRENLMGHRLAQKDLRTYDFRGAYLIGANLQQSDLRGANMLGADLRDANIKGADLSSCLFLTQMQVNGAKGSSQTLLPTYIEMPFHWRGK